MGKSLHVMKANLLKNLYSKNKNGKILLPEHYFLQFHVLFIVIIGENNPFHRKNLEKMQFSHSPTLFNIILLILNKISECR